MRVRAIGTNFPVQRSEFKSLEPVKKSNQGIQEIDGYDELELDDIECLEGELIDESSEAIDGFQHSVGEYGDCFCSGRTAYDSFKEQFCGDSATAYNSMIEGFQSRNDVSWLDQKFAQNRAKLLGTDEPETSVSDLQRERVSTFVG